MLQNIKEIDRLSLQQVHKLYNEMDKHCNAGKREALQANLHLKVYIRHEGIQVTHAGCVCFRLNPNHYGQIC